MPDIIKGTRHSKVTGDFGEHLILYFLSKHGFECSIVDHTGIDIIARNTETDEVMGISVKSRSRLKGKKHEQLLIPGDQFDKADYACKAFNCKPYFAIVIDEADIIYVYILEMKHLLKLHNRNESGVGWSMSKEKIKSYEEDKKIIKFTLNHRIENWWSKDFKK